jgi:hypothetical protein
VRQGGCRGVRVELGVGGPQNAPETRPFSGTVLIDAPRAATIGCSGPEKSWHGGHIIDPGRSCVGPRALHSAGPSHTSWRQRLQTVPDGMMERINALGRLHVGKVQPLHDVVSCCSRTPERKSWN